MFLPDIRGKEQIQERRLQIAMKHPYRWDNLNREELRKLAEENTLVLIPLGATEQHGPHLPAGTDSMLAEAACDIAAKKLDKMGRHAVIAPTVTISNSLHHGSYPGTLSLDPRLYMDYLTSIARGIVSHGFRNICCVNGHGGNGMPTDMAVMDIVTRYGIHISWVPYYVGCNGDFEAILDTQSNIFHADEVETSLMLALDESLVDPCYKEAKGGNVQKGTPHGRPGRPFTFLPFETRTETGILGNSYAATREKGEQLWEAVASHLVQALLDPELWQ